MRKQKMLIAASEMAAHTIIPLLESKDIPTTVVDKLLEPEVDDGPWFDGSKSITFCISRAFVESAVECEPRIINTNGPVKKRGKGKYHNPLYNGRR